MYTDNIRKCFRIDCLFSRIFSVKHVYVRICGANVCGCVWSKLLKAFVRFMNGYRIPMHNVLGIIVLPFMKSEFKNYRKTIFSNKPINQLLLFGFRAIVILY